MSYIGKKPTEAVSEISDGVVVNADVSASAAIAQSKLNLSITNAEVNASAGIVGTKISPDFGSQDVVTTGKSYFANVFTNESDLTTTLATTYHGMFAHAHNTGKAYFSHSNAWHPLAKESDAVLLAGTQTVTGIKTFSAPARGTETTDNDGSFDLSVTNNFKCTTSGNITLTFTNPAAGQSGNIYLDNSGGHTISSASATKIAATDLTTISTAGLYWLSYYTDGTNILVSTTKALT